MTSLFSLLLEGCLCSLWPGAWDPSQIRGCGYLQRGEHSSPGPHPDAPGLYPGMLRQCWGWPHGGSILGPQQGAPGRFSHASVMLCCRSCTGWGWRRGTGAHMVACVSLQRWQPLAPHRGPGWKPLLPTAFLEKKPLLQKRLCAAHLCSQDSVAGPKCRFPSLLVMVLPFSSLKHYCISKQSFFQI